MFANETERYLLSLLPPQDPVLAEVERQGRSLGLPIVGWQEGHLLYLLARMVVAREVLEVGAAIGYSTLWLARAAVPIGGRVLALEWDVHRARQARENLARAGYGHATEVRQGDAFQILPTLQRTFDLIFVDLVCTFGDTESASRLLSLCLPRLNPGGLLITDNALHVGPAEGRRTPTQEGIRHYNRVIAEHPELESIMLPIRDGVLVARRRRQQEELA